jgi:hypothetical protein
MTKRLSNPAGVSRQDDDGACDIFDLSMAMFGRLLAAKTSVRCISPAQV